MSLRFSLFFDDLGFFLFVTCITRTVLSVSALSLPALSALLMLLAEGN